MFVPLIVAIAMAPQHHHGHMRAHGNTRKPVDETAGIKAGYADVQHAFETKNWALFRSRVTSNFQEEQPDHKVYNLRQAMDNLRTQFAPLHDITAKFDLQQIKQDGPSAVCEVRFTASAKLKDKKGEHTMRMDGSETDSLKKVRGRWVAYYAKIHDQSVSVDGHVVSHMP